MHIYICIGDFFFIKTILEGFVHCEYMQRCSHAAVVMHKIKCALRFLHASLPDGRGGVANFQWRSDIETLFSVLKPI